MARKITFLSHKKAQKAQKKKACKVDSFLCVLYVPFCGLNICI
jgi:hypothetical protein